MAYNSTNPVSVGDPTRKSDYDRVFDNTVANRAGVVSGATTDSEFHIGEAATEGTCAELASSTPRRSRMSPRSGPSCRVLSC